MNKLVLTIFLTALIGILGNPLVVSAEEIAVEDFILVVNEDEELTDAEKFEKAKAGLEKALSLAIEKVDKLSGELNAREFAEGSKEAELKNGFLQNLEEYAAYYSGMLERAAALENLESVQSLAKEIRDYRDTVYSPGVEGVVEFILVFYSEDVIRTATERFEKISADIEKLETLGLVEEGIFSEKMGVIEGLLGAASDLRMEAKNAVIPAETEEATTTTSTEEVVEADATSTDEAEADIEESETPQDQQATSTEEVVVSEEVLEEDSPKTPKDLLEESLNNVKESYEIFLEISNSVRETLGLEE